jgi:hypothetical protein
MSDDRRVRRSDRVDEALSYQLDACTERAGLDAMLLADGDGLLVAVSKSSASDSEEIAAILPLLARGHDFTGNLVGHSGATCMEVAVSSFKAAASDLFLCALGGNDEMAFSQMELAKEGVGRILN